MFVTLSYLRSKELLGVKMCVAHLQVEFWNAHLRANAYISGKVWLTILQLLIAFNCKPTFLIGL